MIITASLLKKSLCTMKAVKSSKETDGLGGFLVQPRIIKT